MSLMSSDIINLALAHKSYLCRAAEATVALLDTSEFRNGRSFAVIDITELGASSAAKVFGFTVCHFHELAADYLPARVSSKPCSAVAVNIAAIGRQLSPAMPCSSETLLRQLHACTAAVAAHEYAHNVVAVVKGKHLPEGFTLEQALASLSAKATEPGRHRASHCESWLRAYIHLTTRGAGTSCHPKEWHRALQRDVEAARLGQVAGFIEALKEELQRFDFTHRLADIIRTPAPAGFLQLFAQRDAERSTPEGGS